MPSACHPSPNLFSLHEFRNALVGVFFLLLPRYVASFTCVLTYRLIRLSPTILGPLSLFSLILIAHTANTQRMLSPENEIRIPSGTYIVLVYLQCLAAGVWCDMRAETVWLSAMCHFVFGFTIVGLWEIDRREEVRRREECLLREREILRKGGELSVRYHEFYHELR